LSTFLLLWWRLASACNMSVPVSLGLTHAIVGKIVYNRNVDVTFAQCSDRIHAAETAHGLVVCMLPVTKRGFLFVATVLAASTTVRACYLHFRSTSVRRHQSKKVVNLRGNLFTFSASNCFSNNDLKYCNRDLNHCVYEWWRWTICFRFPTGVRIFLFDTASEQVLGL
jgi:hypothetical protein